MIRAFPLVLLFLLIVAAWLWTKNRALRNEITASQELIAIAAPESMVEDASEPHSLTKAPLSNSEQASGIAFALQGGDHAEIVRSLFAWAKNDPAAALKWFEEDGQHLQSNSAMEFTPGHFLGALLAGIAANHPEQALSHLKASRAKGDGSSDALFFRVAQFLDSTELTRFTEALVREPDSQLRLEGLRSTVSSLALTGRTEAAQTLVARSTQSSDPKERSTVALNFILNARLEGIQEDSAALADWLIKISPEDDVSQNIMSFIDRWASSHYNHTAQWLNEQGSDAPWRDQAVAAFARQAQKADPDTAREWAKTISDEALRITVLGDFD